MTSTNDGKDVKSNQTSGPKGKSYYIELYKFLEARLSEAGDAHERTKHLCVAWRSVHSLCQQSAPSTHTHLLTWLQRHTARAVLQTEWQTPKRKDDRKSLEEAIDAFIGHVAETQRDGTSHPWEEQLVARGEWFKRVLDKPWDHPVLTLLLNPNGTPPTDDEVLAWLKEERGVTFVVRLHTLVGEKCDDIAVSLAAAVMERARAAFPPVVDSEEQTDAPPVQNATPTFADRLKGEAGFTPDVWETLTDIEFVLLHKRDSKRCIALAKQTPFLDAYPLIERLQKRLEVAPREKRLWKNGREVAILIAQVVIARCMVVKTCAGAGRTALYCCARLLARLLAARLPAAADALAAQAPTARHLHTLAQAVDKQLTPTNEEMKPYVCELYVRAITAGMNELERLKLNTEKEAEARSMEKTLATWFVQLGAVLSRSDRIAYECTLTAFSLHPTQKMFERIVAAPPLALLTDSNESNEETVKSEFGSWASDSRSQTNLVKTSETLNMKQNHNKANVLSTAIFNQGEAQGLSPELCQDIAALLSGPRVKTLSWDMDRALLLENCRAYSEVTHEGTRVLTRELKYLNIDPQQYQHLPEEKDDDENDPYYGIERGYEHLAVLDEPEEIWKDASDSKTETSSSIEVDYPVPRRKKKTKRPPRTADEDSDPLSFMAEAKRTQKKKERPHSKERRKSKKKQEEPVDPLDIGGSSQTPLQPKPKPEPKEKKERKRKDKVPKVIGGKRSSLANLVGVKVKNKKKPKEIQTIVIPMSDSDYDSQGKSSLTSLNSEGNEPDALYDVSIPGAERKQEPRPSGTMKNQCRVTYTMTGNKSAPSLLNNLPRMQYRPQTPKNVRQPSPSSFNRTINKNYPEDVRANLSLLLEFRRKRDQQQKLAQNNVPHTPLRKPAIMRPDIPLQANISPKSVTIPEIPKSYINKEQAEKLAELIRMQNQPNPKGSVIQYARKSDTKTKTASSSMDSRNRAQHSIAGSMKMADIVNPSYDRLMAEIVERHSRGQDLIKPGHSHYQPVHSSRPVQRSLNSMSPGQRDYQNFLKRYEPNRYMASTHAIDMSKSAKDVKKPVMPISRVKPVIPNAPKPDVPNVAKPVVPIVPRPDGPIVAKPVVPNILKPDVPNVAKPDVLNVPKPDVPNSAKPDIPNVPKSFVLNVPKPVVPNVPKPRPKKCPKQPVQKKPEPSLNTFSRLSYHKNKQNEMKKYLTPKPVCATTTYQEVSSELDEIIKDYQRAQMEFIQAKREKVDYHKGHPLLSNLLQNTASSSNPSFCRNESLYKNNLIQQTSPAPQKTTLSEKDNNDLLNLLRQQNKLNNSPHSYSSNVNSKPSTSAVSKASPVTTSNPSYQIQQRSNKSASQDAKTYATSLETKIINVISNTLYKPGHHEVSKSLSVSVKPQSNPSTKPVNFTPDKITNTNASKDQREKKYIPESSKPEWQAVMCDLLRHKTPTRGPNALDVALNKSSFELAFEKSLKGATGFSQSQSEVEKVPVKHNEKTERPKPLITSVQNVIITKKGLKLQNEIPKQQKDQSGVPKSHSKHPGITNETLKMLSNSETTKKLPQEVQRKQFTYAGPKYADPFISGIPNSDYDLLEELMDDDLRKEIGELSSDDENYNEAAQSFLKSAKSNEKRVSVQFNKCLNDTATIPATNLSSLIDCQPINEILQPGTPKPSHCANKIAQAPEESNQLKVQQKAANKSQDGDGLMASTSQSISTHISATTNAQNQTYNNVKILTNSQVMIEPNMYISAVPELVYGGYASVQTPVQSINNLAPNAYIAVNSIPTMTLFQTTQYTTPVVIGTSITVPIINKVHGISVQPNVTNNVPQPPHPAVNVEPQTPVVVPQLNTETSETHTEIIQDRVTDCSQQNYEAQEDTKTSERKVLSEVQDFAMTENIDKMRSQKTETNINVNTMKDTATDTDMERLKNKRLAIMNREISHRCGKNTIPLSYSPLPIKITTGLEKYNFSETIPLCYTSNPKEDKQKLSDSEEEKLLAQIKNNLQDLSDAINEVPSPATPDSNDSKENKSYLAVPCRRILLRSSNKITPKQNAEKVVSETPTLKKSKARKIKSEVSDAVAMANDKAKNDKSDEQETIAPKRVSKRLRNKKVSTTTEEKKPLQQQHQKSSTKAIHSSTKKIKSKFENNTDTECLEYLDIESELQGSKIAKLVTENEDKLENDQSSTKDCNITDIEETIMPADKSNENIIDEVPSLSGQSSQNTITPVDNENEDITSEASIPQKTGLSEESTKSATAAVRANEGLQTTGLSEQSSQKAVEIQDISETAEDLKLDEKCAPEHIINKKIADEVSISILPADETISNKLISKTSDNTDDFSEGVANKDGNNAYSKISKPLCDKEEKTLTATNDDASKIPVDAKVLKEVQSVSVPTEKSTKKDETSKINSQRKTDLSEKDNIDLDMTVTCEELPKPNLSPLFGNIKTARSKPINADKKKDLKVGGNVAISNDDIDINRRKIKENETQVAVSHNIELTQKAKPFIETVKGKPTPETCLVNKATPPEVSSSPRSEMSTATNSATDTDDDVVIIDDCTDTKSNDSTDTKSKASLIKHCDNKASTEKRINNEASVLRNRVEPSAENPGISRANDKILVVNHDTETSLLSRNSDNKKQTETNTVVNSKPGDMKDLSEIPQHFKDKINIQHLPSNDPMKKRVRISLPNGRKVIATVGSDVCVTLDTLFAYPSIKEALFNDMNWNIKKRYTMFIKQVTTLDKNNPNKIISAQISELETPAPADASVKPVETIDLLSDDEDSGPPQTNDTNNQAFVTEYGKYATFPMDKDLFLKHQTKLSQKSQILVRKVDEKLDAQVKKIDASTKKVDAKPILPKNIARSGITPFIPNQYVTGLVNDIVQSSIKPLFPNQNVTGVNEIEQTEKTPLIPSQYVTGLLNDIENKLASKVTTTPMVIPEVVEIDDSSNDSLYQNKSAETLTKDKTINDLKNVLLKELGVEIQTRPSANTLQKEQSNDDDVEILEEVHSSKNNNRRKVLKLSAIPTGTSCPFDDLDEEERLQITKRKCAIKLVRCDDLVKMYEQDISDANTPSSDQDLGDDSVTIMEHMSSFNDLDAKIVETVERSSSPVLELFDMLLFSPALSTFAVHRVTPPFCEANWHCTKSMLHLQSVDNNIKQSFVFENDTKMSDNRNDPQIPLSCEANWHATKFTLHLQGVDEETLIRSHVVDLDKNIGDESVIDETIPLTCEANWTTTKPTLHLQSVNDAESILYHVLNDDNEMFDNCSIKKAIPLSCKSNWLTTKPMLHLQGVNIKLDRTRVFDSDSKMEDDSVDKVILLSCEASWCMTKPMLHTQGVNNGVSTRSIVSEYDDEMCDDTKTPLSCEANWLTTKPMLQLQEVNNTALVQSHVFEYDDKMFDDSLIDKAIPLSCEANWLATKAALHLQGANKVALVRSHIIERDDICDDNQAPKEMPLSCEASWLTTKYMLHLQSVKASRSTCCNAVLFDSEIIDDILVDSVIPLSCESQWFTTKATLHMDATRNAILMRSDVLTKGTKKIPLHANHAPSLVSLVLECIQDTNVIQQYRSLRRTSIKRKSSSLQPSAARKVLKLNETNVTIFSESDYLPAATNNISASGFENISGHILQDPKIRSHLEIISEDKSLKSTVCEPKCDDNTNLSISTNVCVDDEKQVPEGDDSGNTGDVEATVDTKTNIGSVDENYTLTETSEVEIKKESDENVDDLSDYRTPSPVIDITQLISFENDTTHSEQSSHNNESLTPAITFKQSPQRSTECNPCNNISAPSFEVDNISYKQEDTNDFENSSTTCTSVKGIMSANSFHKPECSIVSSTYEIEPHINENSNSDVDDIEVKLAEMIGESTLDANNTKSLQNDIINISDTQKSEIIRIILGDEPFVQTENKKIEISVSHDEDIDDFNDTERVNEFSHGNDHEYYISLDATSVLDCLDKSSQDNDEIIYVSNNDMFLSDNESTKEIEEEIVDMRSDEIADDFLYETASNLNAGESDSRKLVDKVSGVEYLEENIVTADENHISQVIIQDDCDNIALHKEKEKTRQEATDEATEKSIESCVVSAKDDIKIEEKPKLSNDVSAESIMNKYLALIRNKSEVLESIVEYEDPEAGTCYVIPIIEESSHTDIESNDNTEVATSVIESPKILKNKSKTVNAGNSPQHHTSFRSNEVSNTRYSRYDDIEARMAEIVGESFLENENNKTNTREIRSEEKYKTSYNVEVEAICSPEKDAEYVGCQLRETDDHDSRTTSVKSLEAKSISSASEKRRSKYHNKSKNASNITDTENLKLKPQKNVYSKGTGEIKNRGKILKRQIDMSDTQTSERKYRKGNQSGLTEIVGESFAEIENKNIRLDEKYKTSYSAAVETISSSERNIEVAVRQQRKTNQVTQKTLVNSLGVKSIGGASKKKRTQYHNKSKDESNIAYTENFKVKLPKHTYSKVIGQIKTRRSLSDFKTSERKYRKSKNIDYPRFTAAALTDTVYTKEYKSLIDYCSSVKFSYAVPFHKEHIDVHDTLKFWPIANTVPQTLEQSVEPNKNLFVEISKSDALLDPLEQTLSEELVGKFDENSYTPSNIHETNFDMGFGERSGRVIQESKDGEYTTFSAATLSDVKQLQPLLPSDEKVKRTNCINKSVHDQKINAMRFDDHLNLRNKVRAFFEKTKAELALESKNYHKKDDIDNSSWPFGDLTSTRCFRPAPVEISVNVVQVGQLPVSAAAQNPVTCDPRVTHVSNASPSQCSPENSIGDELQTPIKTEYTELTTADITLPLMQEYVQHHSMPSESQELTNMYGANENTSMSIVKIEMIEETSQENDEDNVEYENNGFQQVPNGNMSNSVQYQFENITHSQQLTAANFSKTPKTSPTFTKDKPSPVEKPDQLAHAMNAAGISATNGLPKTNHSVEIDTTQQNAHPVITSSQANTNNFSKATPINTMTLQQALSQILPPVLNQTSASENNPQTSTNPQVLHIVQGNNAQSVINKPNGTQLLHIVQNKSAANTNGTPASQQNTFSGLSLVDGAIQQSGNQLLHIVNTANQKNTNAGQLLKRVNLLTNLANVQGSNEQKMVQFVCKSADGKSIQLPHQRSMVLRLHPLDPSNVPTTPKQNDNQDHNSPAATHSINEKDTNTQEMKSRSLYEENYAKFVQNDTKFPQNGDPKPGPEKATSLPKFNQVFGKQVYQDKQSEIDSENLPENADPPEDNAQLEQINDIPNPPMLIRKNNPTLPSHVQTNLVQQIKQTIGPMNIQTMHGGVIYTRQIPVNIGNGQTNLINLITVPSTEVVDDSAQKQQADGKVGNQESDPPLIKFVSTNQPATTSNGSADDNNAPIRSTNETNPQPNPQPQPVLTQMRIKLPMLSKAPQMVGGARVARPSFFQIQRNVIGGANQQVYQQLVLTAAPPLGPSIRLPAQVQKPKTPSETQSSPESQMSSSTLEQLREFDMVLEQVKERSTVQPGSSTSATNNFTKLKSSPDTPDAPTVSKSTQETPTQVLYSVGNTQPLNIVNYVNRKSTITSTTTSSFVRSPDSTGTVESPSSSTHSHLPHTVTSDSCASSCTSEAAATTVVQPKPKKKKPKPSTSNSNPFNIKNTPKPSSQKPLEDEQTTQRILYILAEYKEQVENSPDKDKPAPRRRNAATPSTGSSKRKKSSSGSRRRDESPVTGEDCSRTMGSEDSSCGTSLGECNECSDTHSPEESPKKVVRRLTFEQETQVTQTRTTTTTTIPQRNVIVTDGQAFAVRGATGKPATTVLMPANYLLPVSMVKGGQPIAIMTNRGPKLIVGAGEGGAGGTLLFQRLIGPGGLKPVLTRPGVRHIRLPTAALHNLQAFNMATPAAANVQPLDSTASPAPAPAPPDLVDTRAMSSPWPDRDAEVKPERGNSSPEGSEPWNLPSSSIADDYGYEEIVRTDNMDRTVLVVHRKDGRHTTRLTHVSAAALRHKYAILEHELRLQKSLSEECEDLGVDSPSASELFPEAELLFAPSPAHEQTIDQCHTPQPTIHTQCVSQPDLDDQIATDQLLAHKDRHDDLDINLDVGEIVTVGEDGMTTIPIDHEEFARSHEEFARSHPNTTFHSEPEDGEVPPPFTIAQGIKGRQITFHSRGMPATVVMAPQTTVISQATVEATGTQNPVKFSDIDNMINAMPSPQHTHINMPSVLKESNEGLTKFDRLLNESRELNLSNTTSAIVHLSGNGTQVIRRVQYERRDSRYLVEDDAMIAGDSKTDERRDIMDDTSSSERHPELFWDTQPRPERKRFDFSSDSDKCCKSPYDGTNSDSSGIGVHTRLDSVIKAARTERRRSNGSSAEETHPPLRTYPPKRTHQHTHHSHHHDVDRSVTGKTRASDRCHDVKEESRRRASNRGVVKRGCHCCNGSSPPKQKKSRPKKSSDYQHN